jgi:diadenosine tetraphosphate (Ap4A) HIT family hydrolase
MIAGFEVPHTHVHVVPMNSMAQLDFTNANPNPDQEALDRHLTDLRLALDEAGHSETSRR